MDNLPGVAVAFLLSVITQCFAQDTFYFSVKPQDFDVVEGSETLLLCDVSNRKHITFQWIQSGKTFLNTSRRFQEGSNMHILRVTRDDDFGPFQCIATNVTTGFSLQSGEAKLNIQWIEKKADVLLRRPKEEEVILGADLSFRCQIMGSPEPSFLWYHNKFRLFNTERIKILDRGTRLKISGVTAADNGIYSCRAENVAGAVDSKKNFLLNVKAPGTPHLQEDVFTSYKLVLKNDIAQLDCPFLNAMRIDWFSNYEKISNSTRHTVFKNGSLYFPKVRLSDEGSYRCEGLSENRDSPAQTFTAELVIAHLEEFHSGSFEPRLMSNFPIVVPVHSRFEVKVFPPEGKPLPKLRWLDRNDMLIGDTGRIHIETQNLVFENPQQIDSGNYTCIANNTAGEKRQNVWIIVSVPPMIRRSPQPKQLDESQSINFSCQVHGTPYPVTTILWLKDNEYIKRGSRHHHMNLSTGNLHISHVTLDDVGDYACVANTTGQRVVISSRAYLRVRKKLKFSPRPKDSFLELHSNSKVHCWADAELKPLVRWIKDGSIELPDHVEDRRGTLHFHGVRNSDAGYYTCVAHSATQGFINVTIYIKVVERPKFEIVPQNTTAYEDQPMRMHCVASGVPRPDIYWEKDHQQDAWDYKRFTLLNNGTLYVSKVYMEDQGRYSCVANNSAGSIKMEAFLHVASAAEFRKNQQRQEEEGFNMMKTIIIAVCSAGAYLALVIGLTAFCSYRLIVQKRNRKVLVKTENGDLNREQHELLMKNGDRESGTQMRSDSDNRSHASGMSSHPSHSSQSQAQSQSQSQTQSQTQSHTRSRRGSYDKLHYPRQELQTLGMLGKGKFGDVFLAKAIAIRPGEQESLVMVKSLLSKEEPVFFEFRQEMDMYAKMDHPHVVKLLAVCREMEPQFLITEYCDWGDLKQFLLATKTDNGRKIPRVPPLTLQQKLNICNQVALGMEHISNHRCVHKDLAARNVLLTSRLELKISSLTLCRDVYASEYYLHAQNLIPLRWMSPETILEDYFSTKSDVWSFGVFVWEVFHLGDLPHKMKSDDEVLKSLKMGDATLDISEHCSIEIIDLIRRCTAESPRDRPLFSEVCITVSEILSHSHLNMNLNINM